MSIRAGTVILFGNPELLNFTSEAINGSESGNTRVNKPLVPEEVVVVPIPGRIPVPISIPIPGRIPVPISIPIPGPIPILPRSLSYNLSRLSLKSESKNAPPIITSFFFCNAAASAGTGGAGATAFAILVGIFGRSGTTSLCFAIISFCSFCLFCRATSFSYTFCDFCNSVVVSVYSLL